MKKVEINDDMVRSWVIANKRDEVSVASLSRDNGVSHYVITRRIGEYLDANPDFATKLEQLKLPKATDAVTLVTEPEPPHLADLVAAAAEPIAEDAPAALEINFDDITAALTVMSPTTPVDATQLRQVLAGLSEPGTAAAIATLRQYGFSEQEIADQIKAESERQLKLTESANSSTKVDTAPEPQPQMDDPEPYAAATQELARSRARDLHERVSADTNVIAVQELPSPMLARKQYQPPQVLAFGNLHGVNVDNAMPVARMVGKLVEELNGIPGVKASFNFSYSMHVGA